MKLGYIDYLNCYPFYYHMFEKEKVPGVEIVPGYPSALNRKMRLGEIDMSPMSSAACADISDDVFILPEFCLSSIGYVHSVVLASRFPMEDLDGKTVGLTTASYTSVVLLKVLMEKYFNMAPRYVESAPLPDLKDFDAALLIGNEAMMLKSDPSIYVYDLGEMWLIKTGYPVVFAVFAVRRRAVERIETEMSGVVESYRKSLSCLSEHRQDLIGKAAERYPHVRCDIDTYYNLLRFSFSPGLQEALLFYYQSAGEMGLIKKTSELNFLKL